MVRDPWNYLLLVPTPGPQLPVFHNLFSASRLLYLRILFLLWTLMEEHLRFLCHIGQRTLPGSHHTHNQCGSPYLIAPVQHSTLASLSGKVVSVGGRRDLTTTIGDVYQLHNSQWAGIGCMRTARELPIVAVLPGDRILVVGGYSPTPDSSLTAVELAFLC